MSQGRSRLGRITCRKEQLARAAKTRLGPNRAQKGWQTGQTAHNQNPLPTRQIAKHAGACKHNWLIKGWGWRSIIVFITRHAIVRNTMLKVGERIHKGEDGTAEYNEEYVGLNRIIK